MICNFCRKEINELAGRKGVQAGEGGAVICYHCVMWAKQAVSEPFFVDAKMIHLRDYVEVKKADLPQTIEERIPE
jgi:hypothetical protein